MGIFFRQVIHEDLGCASYLIGDTSTGSAAVVDPQWDVDPYLRLSRLRGLRVEHVLETHNHADHVSGHGRLARATGACVHVHELADVDYPHEGISDGWTLELGDLRIEAVHTPGHRPEHTAFLLTDTSDENPRAFAVLSGDSLFAGGVARPDLAVEAHEGAIELHRSLTERLLALPDEVSVWPGHLGGSMCGGAAVEAKASTTIGFEREHNEIARFPDAEDFASHAVDTAGTKPPNVEHIVALNRGPFIESLGSPAPLSPRAVEVAIAEGAIIVDARTNDQFAEAHIPGSISSSAYDTGFATRVATVVPTDVELIVVAASDGYEIEAVGLLASVGLTVKGFLAGGMTAWRSEARPVERLEVLAPEDLGERRRHSQLAILDVRDPEEAAGGPLPGALNIPYGELLERLGEVPRDRTVAAVCAAGKRSGLAASILQREGFRDVVRVEGSIPHVASELASGPLEPAG
ncbi:MBL fold metallo-hydrolase [Thermoleophilia bacterium SCSIO 60948]|nr:MBL fold metallo-hydrolase [Thermoleophilia bacterium SCSIO 60948]